MKHYRLVLQLCALAAFAGASAQPYSITRIEGLPGATETYVGEMNARGQIVGVSRFPGGETRAFILENGVATDLGSFGGDTSAGRINDHGAIVGYSENAQEERQAFVWTRELGMRPLFPTRTRSAAMDINNAGDIVGSYGNRPFVIRQGVVTFLPTIYGEYSEARAINDAGVIVGLDKPNTEFAFGIKWVDDMPTILPGGLAMWPGKINESGQIVGSHWAFHIHTEYSVTWIGNSVFELPSLVGVGMASGLNERGDMVGWVLDRNWQYGTACLWRNLELVLLQSLITAPGWVLYGAGSISDDGRILGSGTYNGAQAAFMLTPVNGRR